MILSLEVIIIKPRQANLRRPYRFYNQPFSEPSQAKDSQETPDHTDLETGYLPPINLTGLNDQALPEDDSKKEERNQQKFGPEKQPFEKWKTR